MSQYVVNFSKIHIKLVKINKALELDAIGTHTFPLKWFKKLNKKLVDHENAINSSHAFSKLSDWNKFYKGSENARSMNHAFEKNLHVAPQW